MGLFLPINYIILEGVHWGMSYELAQYLVPILNAASFFGRTIPGFVADKIGRFNMMFIMCIYTVQSICLIYLQRAVIEIISIIINFIEKNQQKFS